MVIFFNFSPASNHPYPLQVENCDRNLRLVVDEDDNGKFRLERVNDIKAECLLQTCCLYFCGNYRHISVHWGKTQVNVRMNLSGISLVNQTSRCLKMSL